MYAKLNLLQIGIVGVQPQIFFLETDATLSQITTTGYFNGILASSGFSSSIGDVIVAKYLNQTQSAWFMVSVSGSSFVLTPTGTGTVTGGLSLGGTDAIYAGVSGNDLTFKGLTAGSNITLTPSGTDITIASSGGGGGFAYVNAYWVSQTNGNDANAGTSIDTPFLTVQKAITTAALNATVIYIVDTDNNSETLATAGGGQVLYIQALGTNFTSSLTVGGGDTIAIWCNAIASITNNGSLHLYSTATSTITANNGNIFGNNGGVTFGAAGFASAIDTIAAYTLPTVDGTPNYFLQTNGSGTVSWAAGGSSNYEYTAEYWVDANGSDANTGTSINEPWQTLTYAAANAVAGSIVNLMGDFSDSSTITFTASLTLNGPAAYLAGTYINNAPQLNGFVYSIANYTDNGAGPFGLSASIMTTYVNNTGGVPTYVSFGELTGTNSCINAAAVVFDIKQLTGTLDISGCAININNDVLITGSISNTAGSLNGFLNATVPGLQANSQNTGPLTIGTTTTTGSFYTLPATDGTNGQALLTNGTGTVSWGTAGAPPFAYTNALWVSQSNGNDSNPGTSIETPLQTIQAAITLAGTTRTVIYVVDANSNNVEALLTTSAGQLVYISAPGTTFNGSLTIGAPDTVVIDAPTLAALSNAGTLYTNGLSIASITNTGNIFGNVGGVTYGANGFAPSTGTAAAYDMPTIPGTNGFVLATNGVNAAAWVTPSGGISVPFLYANTIWVSQANGSDLNSGLSIEAPLMTVQAAVTLAALTPTIIYVVDANNSNTEAIATTGLGQQVYIYAPGTEFQSTITQAANDEIILYCALVDGFITNSASPTIINGGNINVTSTSTGQISCTCYTYAGAHTGGATLLLVTQDMSFLSLDSSSTAYVSAPLCSSITNAGTLYIWTNTPPGTCLASNTGNIQGVMGGVTFGTAAVCASTASAAAYTFPTTDGTANYFLKTNGSGTVSWGAGNAGTITGGTSLGGTDAIYASTSGANLQFKGLTAGTNITLTPSGTDITIAAAGGGSNHTYVQNIWVDIVNGNDGNAGTDINDPLLLVQTALTTAAGLSGDVTIFVLGSICTETLTVTGSNPIFIEAPGVQFSAGGITNNNTGVFSIRAYSVQLMTNNNASVNSCFVTCDYCYNYVDQGTSYVTCNYADRFDAEGTATYLNAAYCQTAAITQGTLNISSTYVNTLNLFGGTAYVSIAQAIGTVGLSGGSISGIAGTNIYGQFSVYSNAGALADTYPDTDGTIGQKLTTNGSNVVTWA